MKQKISVALTVVLCLACANFTQAQDMKQQNVEKEEIRAVYYAKAVDPDPNLVILPGTEQETIQYKELPEEQEQVAVIPSTLDSDADRIPTKIAPEGEPDVAVQPPQARRYILECD